MSRAYIIDIETCPKAESELIALMPPAQEMPESIKNPPSVDLSKCPEYKGKKDQLELQEAWKADKMLKWENETLNAQGAWEEKQIETKQKFIDDAALSPVTGTVKLIGIRDVLEKVNHIFVASASVEQGGRLTLPSAKYPSVVVFHFYAFESEMLKAISTAINSGAIIPGSNDRESDHKLIGFYTHFFDWPFLFKRCWFNGVMPPWKLRKGRYWNDSISTDLHEVFTFGDRSQKTGGLNAVAQMLGVKQKTGTGEQFFKLWESDPVAAVNYLCDDLAITEEVAMKMGCIQLPKGRV